MAGKKDDLLDGEFLDESDFDSHEDAKQTPVDKDQFLTREERWTEMPLKDAAPEKKADPKFIVDIEDTTPDEDKGKWVIDDEKDGEPDLPDEQELRGKSKNVQERLKGMTARIHAERRAKDEYYRQLNDAAALAKKLLTENNSLKGVIENGEKMLMAEHGGRIDHQITQAKAKLREAYDAGDGAGIADAQEALARAVSQKERAAAYRPVQLPREDEKSIPQPAQQVDPATADWQDKNQWFGTDDGMTAYALSLHRQLEANRVELGSPKYFSELNKGMRHRFPEKFQDSPERGGSNRGQTPARAQRQSSIVPPVTRNGSGAEPRRVTLTQSEANLARRLGLTLAEYAEQKLVEQSNRNG